MVIRQRGRPITALLQPVLSQQRGNRSRTSFLPNTRTFFSMYIKFCRNYGEDKKDEPGENLSSKLSVELEGEKGGEQTGGNLRLYRAMCLFLTIICFILMIVVIILSLKLQKGSSVCPEREEITTTDSGSRTTWSFEECQANFPNIFSQRIGCQQCPDGWLTFGRSCFYLSTLRLSWYESQQNCTSRGGSLAVINSKAVQDYLTKKGNLQYWIGTSHNNNNKWTWVDNTVLQESYWAEYPKYGGCGVLNSKSSAEKNWISVPCGVATYFICQLKL